MEDSVKEVEVIVIEILDLPELLMIDLKSAITANNKGILLAIAQIVIFLFKFSSKVKRKRKV